MLPELKPIIKGNRFRWSLRFGYHSEMELEIPKTQSMEFPVGSVNPVKKIVEEVGFSIVSEKPDITGKLATITWNRQSSTDFGPVLDKLREAGLEGEYTPKGQYPDEWDNLEA